MARLLLIDGPEGAGKSTLIKAIENDLYVRDLNYEVRHWSTPGRGFHSYIYKSTFAEAIDSELLDVVIWDRGWPSECVYPLLMPQFRNKRRVFWGDWWLAQWYLGRAVQSWGMGVILLGPSVSRLREVRQSRLGDSAVTPDHPIDPLIEVEQFRSFARRFELPRYVNQHSEQFDQTISTSICNLIQTEIREVSGLYRPPGYCGPRDAEVVFVGEALSNTKDHRAWLSFTSHYTTLLGRRFGDLSFKCGWTNTDHLISYCRRVSDSLNCNDRKEFDSFINSKNKLFVACGRAAERFCRDFRVPNWMGIEHPASGFRWGAKQAAYGESLGEVESELRRRFA